METIFKDNTRVPPKLLGNNVKRIREMLGMKQFTLAEGCDWSQQLMSKLESSDTIDDKRLETIAENLGVTPEFIKKFEEEKTICNIMDVHDNTFTDNASADQNYQPIFNNTSCDEVEKLLKTFLQNEEQKSQSLTALGNAVLSLVQEVKKMQEERK